MKGLVLSDVLNIRGVPPNTLIATMRRAHPKLKIMIGNSWVTDQNVSRDNVVTLVKAARARWKIENETFNTLKSQGYHIEHNFGHGRHHLSNNFFVLNLLAFLIHQILELCDNGYQYCRSKLTDS